MSKEADSADATQAPESRRNYAIKPVPFTGVRIDDAFWSRRMETNSKVTVPFAFTKCEETGRIDNFAVAGGLMEGSFKGQYPFDDSDVFKIMEGAAYTLSLDPDEELEEYLDDLIAKIASAQEGDGYLYTARTLHPEHLAHWIGDKRWSTLGWSHELYNAGHMYEAAVAYYQATGKRAFLDVAIKNADLIDDVFGQDKTRDVPGHQELEIGLVKLYQVTGDERYLQLAKFFLDGRGRARERGSYGDYVQDHVPVVEQREAVGHAVRATYMYACMADVAALTGDEDYARAIDRIWENVVSKKLYLTGGIGARRQGEAFGDEYELPNAAAYAETCAAIGNAMWNHRLFLLHGEAKYLDVLERVLYNGFLAGVSMSGDAFFYTNPLESDGESTFNEGVATRSPWFGCSCCPSNVVRFMPSIAGHIYAQRNGILYINLFVGGEGNVEMEKNVVRIRQETGYPWEGVVKITVEPERSEEFEVRVRIPGWVRNRPVPSDLYRYVRQSDEGVKIKVNSVPVALDLAKGFSRIRRVWQRGDVIELDMPMPVRRVLSCNEVADNRGRVALERGPIVYCAEGVDNGGQVHNLVVPDEAALRAEYRKNLLDGVVVICGQVLSQHPRPDGESDAREHDLVAIPYYAWSHRGEGAMAVWLRRRLS